MTRPSRVRVRIRITRDVFSYMVGIGIIIEQTFVANQNTERPILLGVAVGMIGLPTYLQLASRKMDEPDERDKRNERNGNNERTDLA